MYLNCTINYLNVYLTCMINYLNVNLNWMISNLNMYSIKLHDQQFKCVFKLQDQLFKCEFKLDDQLFKCAFKLHDQLFKCVFKLFHRLFKCEFKLDDQLFICVFKLHYNKIHFSAFSVDVREHFFYISNLERHSPNNQVMYTQPFLLLEIPLKKIFLGASRICYNGQFVADLKFELENIFRWQCECNLYIP